MIKHISIVIFISIIIQTNSYSQTPLEKAYQHLYQIMDKYHTTFDVYTDRDGGGNRFFPTKIGNFDAIELIDNYDDSLSFDATSIRISYPIIQVDNKDWAAIQWMFPDTNWGYWPGQDLSGATKLTFLARGELGGERVEFKLGGVNRSPLNDSTKDYMDSADILSTGILTLSTDWQEYSIDLKSPSNFAVYLDGEAGSNNRYIPSGWMNGAFNMTLNPAWNDNPHSGASCIRVDWNGMAGNDGFKWNGVMWQYPENNWCKQDGYDLTGATKLTFWARTDEPGLKLKFWIGDTCDTSDQIFISNTWVLIEKEWKEYTINLEGIDLSNIRGGFGFVFNNTNDPNPDGTVFYLDDIVFDKPLSKNLDNVIAGFICAVSKQDNPQGCTFYVDNIRYNLSDERRNQRLREPHLLESYVTKNESFDIPMRNTAFLYDNALVLLAFLQRGTPEDLWRADVLANTILYCQNNDRDFKDYRLRNAYRSDDLIEPDENYARLPSYWDDSLKVTRQDPSNWGSSTGNITWSIIALLYHAEVQNSAASLEGAEKLGDWILQKCNSIDSLQGYFGGIKFVTDTGYIREKWKSTEHNLDAYVAFTKLYEATGKNKWYDAAKRAEHFIYEMYNNDGPYFWIGTKDSVAINPWPLVEDVQTWALMVLRNKFYNPLINWVIENCRLKCHEFDGIDFNTDRDGIWFEGTAHLALTLWMNGDSTNYHYFIEQLQKAQAHASQTNGLGIVAACHDGLTTGLDWKYFNRLHIGATCWFIFAQSQWNPYWQEPTAVTIHPPNQPIHSFSLLQNYPNPFNSSTQIQFSLPIAEYVSLKIYSINGKLVRSLIDKYLEKGEYKVIWDGKSDNKDIVASGIYFTIMKMGEQGMV